ncbi:hypothetical protein AB0M35_12095 [Micromonospora sp. NPDC051196]|uniref:hypothetical protein n=1 Tax=Micromonospora sp. NPDC051196 TaxID=3155281 RepID=UPI003436146D
MPRRGYSTTIGKIAKVYQDRRRSEMRLLGELLRREQQSTRDADAPVRQRPSAVR